MNCRFLNYTENGVLVEMDISVCMCVFLKVFI